MNCVTDAFRWCGKITIVEKRLVWIDRFQKYGKTLARKRILKNKKKSYLNKKSDFFYFLDHDFSTLKK